jgi:hypothetical protein
MWSFSGGNVGLGLGRGSGSDIVLVIGSKENPLYGDPRLTLPEPLTRRNSFVRAVAEVVASAAELLSCSSLLGCGATLGGGPKGRLLPLLAVAAKVALRVVPVRVAVGLDDTLVGGPKAREE